MSARGLLWAEVKYKGRQANAMQGLPSLGMTGTLRRADELRPVWMSVKLNVKVKTASKNIL